MNTLVNTDLGPTLLDTWKTCGGYYSCPEGPNGELLGPIVGCAGKYEDGGEQKNYVGTEYYNFAAVEKHHRAVRQFAIEAAQSFMHSTYKETSKAPTLVLAAPMGGIVFGQNCAHCLDTQFGFAEKKVLKAPQGGQREESQLVLDRHTVKPGDLVVIAEDVVNNFSTTNQLVRLIEKSGGEVLGLMCALNRSEAGLTLWHPSPSDLPLRVSSAVFKPTPQYRQDHPKVAEHIQSSKIVWKPKDNWKTLATAMTV